MRQLCCVGKKSIDNGKKLFAIDNNIRAYVYFLINEGLKIMVSATAKLWNKNFSLVTLCFAVAILFEIFASSPWVAVFIAVSISAAITIYSFKHLRNI